MKNDIILVQKIRVRYEEQWHQNIIVATIVLNVSIIAFRKHRVRKINLNLLQFKKYVKLLVTQTLDRAEYSLT